MYYVALGAYRADHPPDIDDQHYSELGLKDTGWGSPASVRALRQDGGVSSDLILRRNARARLPFTVSKNKLLDFGSDISAIKK
jgi:hypothetical protein